MNNGDKCGENCEASGKKEPDISGAPCEEGKEGDTSQSSVDPDEEELTCRLCYDVETDPILDPMLRPCKCKGSMANIHHSCLFESRVNSFNPKSLSECVLCGCVYRTVDTKGHLTPSDTNRELFLAVCKFVGIRTGVFTLIVIAMGFLPAMALGGEYVSMLPRIESSKVADHLLKGTLSTLTCAGGWFAATVFNFGFWLRLFHNPFGRFGGRYLNQDRKGQQGQDARLYLALLAAAGLLFLLYHLAVGVWEIVRGANATAGVGLRNANRSIREDIAKRHRVTNLVSEAADCPRGDGRGPEAASSTPKQTTRQRQTEVPEID